MFKMRVKTGVLAILAIGFISMIIFISMQNIYRAKIFPFNIVQLKNYIKNKTFRYNSKLTYGYGANSNTSLEPLTYLINWKFNSVMLARDYDVSATCITTPFVICNDAASHEPSLTNETFGIALLRKPSWLSVDKYFNFSQCQYSNCYFQDDHINGSTSMVIIEIVEMSDLFTPVQKWPHQLYVAFTGECPKYTFAPFLNDRNSFWNKAFNLTATYRTDSDLFVYFGKLRFQPKPVGERPIYFEIAKNKTKWALWIVSNCKTPSRRNEYVQQMQKIIDVDIFGKCGKKCTHQSFMCSEIDFTLYRYYLSFENTFCFEYITEKYFKLFNPDIHIIPVVRGAFEYKKYLPKDTYINSADFQNATQLALHLKHLGEDPLAYSRYLQQIDMYQEIPSTNLKSIGCEACKYLHMVNVKKQINDLKKWMVDDKCFLPKDL